MAQELKTEGKYYAVTVSAGGKGIVPSIDYYLRPGTTAPDDYVSLHLDLERTLTVVRVLFFCKHKNEKFDEYFHKVGDIAQAALGQDQVRVGRLALTALQDEVVTREAGHVKNAYVRRLGIYALAFAVPAIIFYLYCRYKVDLRSDLHRLREFISMLAGSFLGTWLSFSIRRVQLSFWDLTRLEEDMLDPGIRLLFVAGLTVVVGLLLATNAVVVTIGGFNSHFLNSGMIAVLIGCLCGIGEIGLSSAVARRASEFTAILGVTRGPPAPTSPAHSTPTTTPTPNAAPTSTTTAPPAPPLTVRTI